MLEVGIKPGWTGCKQNFINWAKPSSQDESYKSLKRQNKVEKEEKKWKAIKNKGSKKLKHKKLHNQDK
jgi:DNA-binding transcriptional regulator YhcF (GntR family)